MSRRFLVLLTLLLFQAPAVALQPFAATKEELALMPAYCSVPNKSLGEACYPLNHYCDALKAMIRVDQNQAESRYWLGIAVATFERELSGHWEKCPLKPEAHVNLGRALLRQDGITGVSSGKAVANFTQAIAIQPDYIPGYYALSDYYVQLGDKKKALNAVEEGLKYLPNSKALLRRFKELGGTTPPAPVVITSKPEVSAAAKDASAAQHKTPIESAITQPAADGAPPVQKAPAEQSTTPKIGSPSNPWCRFCPPE